MNDDVIQDLKQFITSTVSQALSVQTTDLRQDFDRLEAKVVKLETKIDDVDAKADAILEAVGENFNNHEQRITKLEHASRLAA